MLCGILYVLYCTVEVGYACRSLMPIILPLLISFGATLVIYWFCLLVIQRASFWFKPQIKLKNCVSDLIIFYLKGTRPISQNTVSAEGISMV